MSFVWKYFTKSAGVAICKHCNDYSKEYPPGTSPTFLRAHLQTKHHEQFSQMLKDEETKKKEKRALILSNQSIRKSFANASTSNENPGISSENSLEISVNIMFCY